MLFPDQRASVCLRAATANRNSQLAIDGPSRAFSDHHVRTEVEPEAVSKVGDGAAADMAAFLEDRDVAAAAREINR